MNKSLLLVFTFLFLSTIVFSQTNDSFVKEARLSAGMGIGGASNNTLKVGRDNWVQLSYSVIKRVEVALEFENLGYKAPGFIKNLPVTPNEIVAVDNNFSLLLKYSLPVPSALKVVIASGWSTGVHQSKYYNYEFDSASQRITPTVTSWSDYGIPLLLEIKYPVVKTIYIQLRTKYNLNPNNNHTYAVAAGLSLKL